MCGKKLRRNHVSLSQENFPENIDLDFYSYGCLLDVDHFNN